MLEESFNSPWQMLPDSVLLHIFSFVDAVNLLKCSQCCKSWNRVAYDEFLWKDLFYNDWKLSRSIGRKPGKYSWLAEYKRLKYHTPMVETEVLREHSDQVLHVSFSHNGEMFSTSSKDGYAKVWNAEYPAKVRYSADMKKYHWKYTQFSQFNESDTLLLVSGVHTGPHSTSGEIIVFSLDDEFTMQSKVINKPYDIFGTWYNDNYLMSGQLLWLGQMLSSSVLWLNYAYQETEVPDKSVVTKLYKFYNKNASSIRTITIANCIDTEEPKIDIDNPIPTCMESVSRVRETPMKLDQDGGDLLATGPSVSRETPEVTTNHKRHRSRLRRLTDPDSLVDLGNSILLEDDWKDEESDFDDFMSDEELPVNQSYIFAPNPNIVPRQMLERGNAGDVLDDREKYLIFTTGSKTYTPHQIGFKRIKPFKFRDKISMNLSDKLAEHQERLSSQSNSPNYQDESSVQHMFDKVDHLIDLHGHIIGIALSPDHRYLYVNNRPWPKDYVIEDPFKPPPIAHKIGIHVIDLVTLKEVGTMLRAHEAYTPNDECFFIFLDVCDEFVASGAEDKRGYLWDRHYGICLAQFPHKDVVNSVAFNPVDSEVLVTASDDFTLKIWRSKNRAREIAASRNEPKKNFSSFRLES